MIIPAGTTLEFQPDDTREIVFRSCGPVSVHTGGRYIVRFLDGTRSVIFVKAGEPHVLGVNEILEGKIE